MRSLRVRTARAQATVEFALVAPILFLLLIGVLDLGRMFAIWVTMQQGAQEAARLGTFAKLGVPDPDTGLPTGISSKSTRDIVFDTQNNTPFIGTDLQDCSGNTEGGIDPESITSNICTSLST